MPMTPSQMVAFFKQQTELSLNASHKAKANKNYDLSAFNLNRSFSTYLMAGLIQWRHELANPSFEIRNALALAGEMGLILDEIDTSRFHKSIFDFGSAQLLSYTLDKKSTPNIPSTNEFGEGLDVGKDEILRVLSGGLAIALERGVPPAGWDEVIANLAHDKRMELVRETFTTYLTIIKQSRKHDFDAAISAVEAAASLFRQRKRDNYFAGGLQTEGGGLDNDNVVDYRLAALIRCCLPDEKQKLIPNECSIHIWKWS